MGERERQERNSKEENRTHVMYTCISTGGSTTCTVDKKRVHVCEHMLLEYHSHSALLCPLSCPSLPLSLSPLSPLSPLLSLPSLPSPLPSPSSSTLQRRGRCMGEGAQPRHPPQQLRFPRANTQVHGVYMCTAQHPEPAICATHAQRV